MRSVLVTCLFLTACATTSPRGDAPTEGPAFADGEMNILELEQRAKQLVLTTAQLDATRNSLDEQRRRLAVICNDYPKHEVCDAQTQASYAREAFCSDKAFTEHVNAVIDACHQGQCKQVDTAALITRTDYMLLVQRLPHTLVTFGNAETRLGGEDKKQVQRFLETLGGEQGYVIVVGRASKDGPWEKNLRYALDRAEATRGYLVDQLGLDAKKVGYITYGHEKMYLTGLDVERLSTKKLGSTAANRSALVFAYPCFAPKPASSTAPAAP